MLCFSRLFALWINPSTKESFPSQFASLFWVCPQSIKAQTSNIFSHTYFRKQQPKENRNDEDSPLTDERTCGEGNLEMFVTSTFLSHTVRCLPTSRWLFSRSPIQTCLFGKWYVLLRVSSSGPRAHSFRMQSRERSISSQFSSQRMQRFHLHYLKYVKIFLFRSSLRLQFSNSSVRVEKENERKEKREQRTE